jgi:hypothetical protein
VVAPFLSQNQAFFFLTGQQVIHEISGLARIFHELTSRDSEDALAAGQPQELGPEAYLNGTSQGLRSEDAQEEDHIRCRSRPFMKYAG